MIFKHFWNVVYSQKDPGKRWWAPQDCAIAITSPQDELIIQDIISQSQKVRSDQLASIWQRSQQKMIRGSLYVSEKQLRHKHCWIVGKSLQKHLQAFQSFMDCPLENNNKNRCLPQKNHWRNRKCFPQNSGACFTLFWWIFLPGSSAIRTWTWTKGRQIWFCFRLERMGMASPPQNNIEDND